MKKIPLESRAEFYNSKFWRYPSSMLRVVNGLMSGAWMLGNDYRNKTKLFGAYPPQYLARVQSMFPDAERVMHLFSGSLPKGDYTRVDLKRNRDHTVDAHHLSDHFKKRKFDIVYADPPYHKGAAAIYGVPMINRLRVLNECSAVLDRGGFVVWLDTVWPMVARDKLKLVGFIGLARSQNHVVRGIFIMRKP